MPIAMQPTEIFQAPGAPGTPPAAAPPPSAPAAPPPTVPPDIAAMMPPPGDNKKKLLFIGIGVLVLLVVIIFVVRLVSSASSNAEEDEKAELTYWGLYEDPKVMQVLLDDFHRENPKITVKYTQQSPDGYRDRLMTRIKSGTGPDIFQFHNAWVPMLTGTLLPLSQDAVNPKEFEKVYYKVIRSDLVKNGGILGIPLRIDTLALYTNDQMFSSQQLNPPKDWDQFVQAAGGLTVRADDGPQKGRITTAGAAIGTYDNISHAPDLISLLLVQTRVDLTDIGKHPNEAGEALAYYTLFAKNGGDVQKVWDGTLDPSVVAFANGRVGMFFGYSWDMFTIRALNPSLAFSVHPVPQLDSANKKTIASYWVEGVSRGTKYPKAAMKFMAFLNQKETQQKYYTETVKASKLGSPYARVDLAATLKSEPLLAPFVEQASYAVSTPFVGDTRDNGLNATVNGYLKNAVLSLSDNTSAESAVSTLDQGVKQAFAQYGQ